MRKRETRPLNINMDAELHRQTKIRAAEQRKSMTEIIEAALVLYLNQKGKVDITHP
jgi:predicted HicB family RNase H-like nuclease